MIRLYNDYSLIMKEEEEGGNDKRQIPVHDSSTISSSPLLNTASCSDFHRYLDLSQQLPLEELELILNNLLVDKRHRKENKQEEATAADPSAMPTPHTLATTRLLPHLKHWFQQYSHSPPSLLYAIQQMNMRIATIQGYASRLALLVIYHVIFCRSSLFRRLLCSTIHSWCAHTMGINSSNTNKNIQNIYKIQFKPLKEEEERKQLQLYVMKVLIYWDHHYGSAFLLLHHAYEYLLKHYPIYQSIARQYEETWRTKQQQEKEAEEQEKTIALQQNINNFHYAQLLPPLSPTLSTLATMIVEIESLLELLFPNPSQLMENWEHKKNMEQLSSQNVPSPAAPPSLTPTDPNSSIVWEEEEEGEEEGGQQEEEADEFNILQMSENSAVLPPSHRISIDFDPHLSPLDPSAHDLLYQQLREHWKIIQKIYRPQLEEWKDIIEKQHSSDTITSSSSSSLSIQSPPSPSLLYSILNKLEQIQEKCKRLDIHIEQQERQPSLLISSLSTSSPPTSSPPVLPAPPLTGAHKSIALLKQRQQAQQKASERIRHIKRERLKELKQQEQARKKLRHHPPPPPTDVFNNPPLFEVMKRTPGETKQEKQQGNSSIKVENVEEF